MLFRYMHVQIRLPTHNIVLWSVPPTYEWGQGHNIELIRLVLEPNFLDPKQMSVALLQVRQETWKQG